MDIKGTADLKSGKQIGLYTGAIGLVLLLLLFLPPQQLNGLWQAVAAIRSSIRSGYTVLSVSLVCGALAITLFWCRRKGLEGLRRGSFILSLALAFAGEMFLLDQAFAAGAVLYLAGAVVLIAQPLFGDDRAGQALEWSAWPRKKEAVAFILVLASAFLTHFYLLGRVPYGVEGDESSWALRVVEAMNQGRAGLPYPFAQMPTSFWLQSLSYHLFGTSIESARLGVALLSLAGTVLFYFAARETVNIPVALIATYLLGISLIDMAASRQAHVETYVKIWIMGAVACMLWGYRGRKALLFAVAGACLAMGLMVYDSFAFTPFALFAYVVWRLIRDRKNWREHLAYLGAMLLPVAAVAPGVWTYLEGRRISQVATLTFETGVYPDSMGKITTLLPRLTDFALKYAGVTLERLTVQQLNDVLIGRPGPLESAAFVPILFLGLFFAVRYWRLRHVSFALFWVLVPGLPTSLVLGQAFARTYYPFLGGLVVLAAIALWVTFSALRQGLDGNIRFGLTAILVTFLAALGLSNGYVYFNEVWDPPERQVRREFGELLSRHVRPAQMVYLPYTPLENDFFESEWRYARYIASSLSPGGDPNQLFTSIPYPQLLQTISNHRAEIGGIKGFYDKTNPILDERQSILQALERCYPNHSLEVGRFMDVYSISSEALSQSTCSSTVDLKLTWPAMGQTIAANSDLEFSWQMSTVQTTAFRLVLEKRNDQVVWLEAEDLQGRGWEAQKHLAGQYTGSAYLADVASPENLAESVVEIPKADKYNIWVRTLRRRADGSPVLLHIADASLEIGSDQTNGWDWQSLGWYELPAGKQRVAITREYDANSPWQIFIDTLLLSRQAGFDPDTVREWESVLDTSTVSSARNQFRYELPLADGDYRWRVEVFDGDRIIGWDGKPGYTSPNSLFSVNHAATNAN
jgi:4-amino-4-deoxy-L-arabinose transferase-like glycosyltransferase